MTDNPMTRKKYFSKPCGYALFVFWVPRIGLAKSWIMILNVYVLKKLMIHIIDNINFNFNAKEFFSLLNWKIKKQKKDL